MFSRHPWFLILPLFLSVVPAQEWTRFRGPNGAGLSTAKTIPAKWTERHINWKIELPGVGHSSPVIWANKVFITSADERGSRVFVQCVSAGDGSVFWQKELALAPYPLHKFNTFASPSPAVDEERVYVSWLTRGHYRLTAFDHGGKVVWERDLGPFESQHGAGSSPIVYRDRVILVKDPDGESFVVAVDAKSGQTRWQTPIRGTRADYSTPCLYEADGARPVFIFNSMENGVLAIDASDGRIAWQLEKVFDKRSVSSPVIASGLIIGSCGSGGGGNYVVAVRPPDAAGRLKPSLAYQIRRSAAYVPTSVALGELLFVWSDGGVVTCLHAPSGKVKWQERVGGNFFASPICVDGKLFGVSSTGQVIVLEASDTFRELSRYELNEGSHATPAVSGGRMYIRTLKHLLSIGGS